MVPYSGRTFRESLFSAGVPCGFFAICHFAFFLFVFAPVVCFSSYSAVAPCSLFSMVLCGVLTVVLCAVSLQRHFLGVVLRVGVLLFHLLYIDASVRYGTLRLLCSGGTSRQLLCSKALRPLCSSGTAVSLRWCLCGFISVWYLRPCSCALRLLCKR